MPDRRWVALLRAIGGATHARMSMADLRAAAAEAGLGDPRTVLATGNLLVTSDWPEPRIRAALDRIVAGFGLSTEAQAVILRRQPDLARILAAPAFPDAAEARPSRCLVVFLDGTPDPSGLDTLRARAGAERLSLSGRELTVDYAAGVGTSKLTIKLIERALGTLATGRNWTTVRRLSEAA